MSIEFNFIYIILSYVFSCYPQNYPGALILVSH